MERSLLVRAVLVDMDGTAVDSNAIVELSWARVAEEFNLDPEELLAFAHGRPGVQTFAHFVPSMSAEEATQRVSEMLAHEETVAHLARPIPGADHFLAQLESLGVPWAVVTSAPRRLAKARFAASGLPWPKVSVAVEDISLGKPDPEGYQAAAASLGMEPEDCVVFEDAMAGIQAGLNAGSPVVVIDAANTLSANATNPEPALAGVVAVLPDFENVTVEPTDTLGVFKLSV